MHNLLERVAQELWSRFAPEHHIEWEDEQGKAEYRLAAEAVLDLASHTPAPQPGGAVKVTVGYSLANEWWWVRIYPCTSEQDARRLGRRILSALEPSPSGWNAGAEAMREACASLIEKNQIGHSSHGPDYLAPRYDGNREALAYAGFIRAISRPTDKEG